MWLKSGLFWNHLIEYIKGDDVTLFLDVSVDELFKRMNQNNGTLDRPLLQGKQEEALKQELEKKYKDRYPFYNEAQIVLKGDNIQPEHLINAIESEG